MKRALRRHHRERLKNKRKHHWGRNLTDEERAGAVDTPTPCSCYMCGNPRRYFNELTIQERRQFQKDKYEELDYNDEIME